MHGMYMGNNRLLIQTVYGGRLIAPSADLSTTPELTATGAIEMPLTRYLMNHVKHGQTVIDIGANIGYFAVLLGYLVGPAGKLICYEANPELYRYLFDNLSLNYLHDRTAVYPAAVYSVDTELSFYQSKRFMGNSSIHAHGEFYHQHYLDEIERIDVQAVRLEEQLQPIRHIDLIKMDIEGGEYHAFIGLGGRVQEDVKTVVFEINREMLQHDWPLFKQLLTQYHDEYGKKFFIINNEGNEIPAPLSDILERGSFPYIVMKS